MPGGDRHLRISGAVGTFAHVDPRVEAYVAANSAWRSSRFPRRSSRATGMPRFSATLGVIAAGIERLATEVRHLQRSEVREAEEFFHAAEGFAACRISATRCFGNLSGLARLVRAASSPRLENVALWHERDISHSSVERGIGPDATVTLDFALTVWPA